MKNLIFLFALGCGSGATSAETPAAAAVEAGPSRNVDVAQLKADLDAGKVPMLVDVRTAGEYAGGHVPGAVNIPVDQIAKRTSEITVDDGAEVYLICKSGGRSASAASTLSGLGFATVNVSGGTGAWIGAGNAVE
ncbi:MAG: rhodanese-like domain-containing protein [Proteobacteria bacterium]|nr:rhodanese-like domain-containing protein [Pseudomonadota bacterium]